MSFDELLAWGRRFHYPRLVLANGTVLPHGELVWYVWLIGNTGMQGQVQARIAEWEARYEGKAAL